MLTRNHRQETLSRAYVHAIAGVCGLSCSGREYDYGVDLTLHEIRQRGDRFSESGFKLDVQAKSTGPKQWSATQLFFDLPVWNYDDLRDTTAGGYRILVVLVVPEEEAEWIDQTQSQLLLRYAAYWICLRGAPTTRNRKFIRIKIPCEKLFSAEALRAVMAKIVRGEPV